MSHIFSRRFTNLSKIWVTGALVLVLLLSACGRGNEEAATGDADAGESAAEPASETAVDSTDDADSADAESDDDASDSADSASAAAAPGTVTVASIDNVEDIQSFRMRFSISGIEGEQVSVEGEFVKEPPAQRLRVDMTGSAPQTLETLVVGGTRYTKVRNRWIQTPGDRFNIDEIAPFTPDIVTGDLENVEELGTETVNDRATTHYRVNTDALPPIPFNRNGEQQDLSTLGSVQLDLWVDQEERFVVKMLATVENAEATTPVEMLYEYYDLNAPITIEVPN